MQKKFAFYLLGFVFLVTQLLGFQLQHLSFDYDFEKFFPASDPDTDFFNDYRKKFESDNDFILIGIVRKEGVFNREFLKQADTLEKQLRELPDVVRTMSLLSYREPVSSAAFGRMIFMRPAIHIDDTSLYESDSVRIFNSEIFRGNLIAENAQSLCILLSTEQYISKERSDRMAENISAVLSQYDFDEVNVAGRSTGQSYYVGLMQGELLFFTFTSFFLVVLFLAVTFRTVWGIWVPILVVVLTVVWILGFMSFMREGINLVLTILPTIMFVVGMSDVVHIMTHYLHELRKGRTKSEAISITYREIGIATFLTSLTTSIGFLTLLSSAIEPVRTFGIYTAIGIFFAYVLAFTLLPGVLLLNNVPAIALKQNASRHWNLYLSRLFRFTMRNQAGIVISVGILIIVSVFGMTKLRFNNFLLEDLKDSNELKQQFIFFEKNYSGVRPFEMAVFVRQKSGDHLLDLEALREVEKVEDYLKSRYGAGFLLSPNTIIKSINKASHAGKDTFYKLPETQDDLDDLVAKAETFRSRSALKTTVADQGRLLRISGKTPDFGSYNFKFRNDSLDRFIKLNTDSSLVDFKLTGTAVLIDKNNGNLSSGLVFGLVISFVIIGGMFGLMFFSWKMILISLLPNLVPLVIVAGIMGFFQIDLKVSTSMIFTIAFGIAVDDSIHFLTRYKLEKRSGKSILYALKNTYLTTGKAILVTTMILSGGFLTLIFSDFLGTFYIGLLIGLTLIIAVVMDLLLLPVLLAWMDRKP